MVGISYFGMIIGLGKFPCGLNFPAFLILLFVRGVSWRMCGGLGGRLVVGGGSGGVGYWLGRRRA